MSVPSGLPSEVERELNELIARVVLLARPRDRQARALAEAVRDVWMHGTRYAEELLAEKLGVKLPDDREQA